MCSQQQGFQAFGQRNRDLTSVSDLLGHCQPITKEPIIQKLSHEQESKVGAQQREFKEARAESKVMKDLEQVKLINLQREEQQRQDQKRQTQLQQELQQQQLRKNKMQKAQQERTIKQNKESKGMKELSRKMSDTKFREVYNKPLFGQFGGMNTLRPKTFEGDYMGSHNIHCRQNNLNRKSEYYKGNQEVAAEEVEPRVSKKEQFNSIQQDIRSSQAAIKDMVTHSQNQLRPASHSHQWNIIKQQDPRTPYDNKHNLLYIKKQNEKRHQDKEQQEKERQLKKEQLRRQVAQLDYKQKQLEKQKKGKVTGKINAKTMDEAKVLYSQHWEKIQVAKEMVKERLEGLAQ